MVEYLINKFLITTNDIITGLTNLSSSQEDFEKLYIACRKKENRFYTDEQAAQLPQIEPSHIHYPEWEMRKRSTTRLKICLENKNKPLTVLEVGCGNGWLSAGLATIKDSVITGVDINKTELEQAQRVFYKIKNVSFIEGDIRTIDFKNIKFDVIIFAASIQYFPSVKEIIQAALSLLNEGGEIHILDSYLYEMSETENARKRSLSYYHSLGYEEMAAFYYHHSIDELSSFHYKLLFDPATIKNKIFGKKDPFPWICIKRT